MKGGRAMLGFADRSPWRNLKCNLPVFLSFLAAYASEYVPGDMFARDEVTVPFGISVSLGCAGAAALCALMLPWTEIRKGASKTLRGFSLLSALGLSFARIQIAGGNVLLQAARVSAAACLVSAAVIFAGCLFLSYLLCMWVTGSVAGVLRRSRYVLDPGERAVLAAGILACFAACAAFCSLTALPYSDKPMYDTIYQFDSGAVIRSMTYVRFSDPGNGAHQPLFAVFAAPFAGVPYLAAFFLGGSAKAFAISGSAAQSAAVALGFSFLGHAMGLSPRGRIRWLAVCFASFPYFLFSLCIEQYACGFFYAALLVLGASGTRRPGEFEACAAAGCAVTSAALLAPAAWDARPWRGMFPKKAAGLALKLVVFMCAFLKAPLPGWVVSCGKDVMAYASAGWSGFDPAKQLRYALSMVRSVFVAPASGPMDIAVRLGDRAHMFPELAGMELWAQQDAAPSVLAVCLLAGAVCGFLACRREAWARMAFCQLAAGLFVVGVLGLGVPDGATVLYVLYFGWPVPCLLAGLGRKALAGRRVPAWALDAAVLAACAAMLAWNVPVFMDMLRFGVSRYPA